MDVVLFEKVILDTCIRQCKGAILLLAVGVLLLVIDIIYYCVTKNNEGLSLFGLVFGKKVFENRFTTKQQIFLKVVGIVALFVLIGWTIIPAYRDISKQQYICVSGECTYITDSRRSLSSNGRVRVETEEDVFFLELPVSWDSKELFNGTEQGQVCYSKESKILLSFKSKTQ